MQTAESTALTTLTCGRIRPPRDDHEEAQAQPGQVRAGHPALLAELHVTGGQPGEEVDQVPEHHRAQP